MVYDDIECPYCNAGQDIDHDDGYGYSENETHQQRCRKCDSTFTYTTSISFYYEADKAPCLNGEEHQYKPTHTHPDCWTRMRCVWCDEERSLTEEERVEMKIPTVEEYMKTLK